MRGIPSFLTRVGIAVGGGLLLAFVCGLAVESITRETERATTDRDADAVFDRELAIAVGAGLSVVSEAHEPFDEPVASSVDLTPGECVGIVAVVYGAGFISSASLLVEPVRASAARERAIHLAICSASGGRAWFSLVHDFALFGPFERRLRFAVLRGSPADPRRYAPAVIDGVLVDRLEREDALASRPGESAGELARLEIPATEGRVLPASAATLGAMRALARTDARLALGDAVDPAAPDGAPVTPRTHVGLDVRRVLLVVDAGAFGSPCIRVEITPLRSVDTVVERLAVPALERLVIERRAKTFFDRVCPANGLLAYTTDSSVAHLVVVRSRPGEGTPMPSRWTPVALEPEPVVSARRACEARESSGCLTLARLAAGGLAEAGDVRLRLEQTCELGGPASCGPLAAHLLASADETDRTRGDALEQSACRHGDTASCRARAERFRAGATNIDAARQLFLHLCRRHGDSAACETEARMAEYELGARPADLEPAILP